MPAGLVMCRLRGDGGDPPSHQLRPWPERSAPPRPLSYFDCQDFGAWSLAAVILRCQLTSWAAGDRDGYADCRARSRMLDRVAHRGGDDEVCDLLYFRIGAEVCHVRVDRRVYRAAC